MLAQAASEPYTVIHAMSTSLMWPTSCSLAGNCWFTRLLPITGNLRARDDFACNPYLTAHIQGWHCSPEQPSSSALEPPCLDPAIPSNTMAQVGLAAFACAVMLNSCHAISHGCYRQLIGAWYCRSRMQKQCPPRMPNAPSPRYPCCGIPHLVGKLKHYMHNEHTCMTYAQLMLL